MSGASIVVLGNCQRLAWGRTLNLIVPGSTVVTFGPDELTDLAVRAEALAQFAAADVALSVNWRPEWGELAPEPLLRLRPDAVIVPTVRFHGFHPDMTWLTDAAGAHLPGAMGAYHSILCVAGFLAGFSAAQTVRRFNSLTFNRLGYFDVYARAKPELEARFAAWGYDIAPLFPRWEARGAYMTSINHPRHFVLSDVMRLVCQTRAIGEPRDWDYSAFFPDELVEGAVFPVYPEIGRRLGVPGDYLFKPPNPPSRAELLDLDTFVERAFEGYGELGVAALPRSPQVAAAVQILSTPG